MNKPVFVLDSCHAVRQLDKPKKGRWVERWEVWGDQQDQYTVARDACGVFGCSCPRWKFRREECKHIDRVKRWESTRTYWVEYMTKSGISVRWHPATAHKDIDEAKREAIAQGKRRRRITRVHVVYWHA